MRIAPRWLLMGMTAVTVGAAACDDTALQPAPVFPPLEPDTGNLGLPILAGLQALTIVDDSVVKDSALMVWLARRRSEPTSAAVRVGRMEAGLDSLLTVGRALAFDVSPTRRLVFVGERVMQYPTYTSWRGVLQGGLYGEANLHNNGGRLSGDILVAGGPTRMYSRHAIQSFGPDFHLITYIDWRKFLPD
ncbi:MAG: hypothetical protein H7Z40_13145 [Phycisphaerae bacterium]|nr:hypothetical protein [Gemmatimonadaceae bacterium]